MMRCFGASAKHHSREAEASARVLVLFLVTGLARRGMRTVECMKGSSGMSSGAAGAVIPSPQATSTRASGWLTRYMVSQIKNQTPHSVLH